MDKRILTYSLHADFIQELSDYIEQEYIKPGRDLSRLAIVFGGKRPALFLKRELARRLKKGFFPARSFSIDEFMEYLVGRAEPHTAIADLDACYAVYHLAGSAAAEILKGREKFSEFLPWGREILSFIEQLDLEDIGEGALRNIQANAGIGYDVPDTINALLVHITALRRAYHDYMRENAAYSRGFTYLRAGRLISGTSCDEFDEIFFCGFFYLHTSEELVIRHLYGIQKARLFFQGSEDDWSVLKDLGRVFSCRIRPEGSGTHELRPARLTIQAGSDVHSQSCLVREALKSVPAGDKTVVVLPDPNNLMPLLSEIARDIKDFNLSMGYPLKRSAIYSLFAAVAAAQETRRDGAYYVRDYLAALSHPLIKNLLIHEQPAVTRVLVHKIEEVLSGKEDTGLGGSLFIMPDTLRNSRELYDLTMNTMKKMGLEAGRAELKEVVTRLHDILFLSWEDISTFAGFGKALEHFLDAITASSQLGHYPLNIKMAERMYGLSAELKNAAFNAEPFPREEIFRIFENRLEREIVSFSGSPLKGLQVLGLFETRSLKFDHVIVMDMNEAVLPNLQIYEPLIPREVMISLGLNRLENEEEIQRYQFQRLIAGARSAHLVFQQGAAKEKSRFIEELIWREQKAAGRLDVLPIARARFEVTVLPHTAAIPKNEAVLRFLRAREYSASSLNMYLHCPLRFYYHYVLGLREKEAIAGELEGADIGTFVHELLEEMFADFIGKKPAINRQFRTRFFKRFDEIFTESFERRMKADAFLTKEVLRFRLEAFLDHENERQVRSLVCLEKEFKGRVVLGETSIACVARIDRIDRLLDGSLLVLDYKTGSTDVMPQPAARIEGGGLRRLALKDTLKSFQLPLYLYFVERAPGFEGADVNAALYSLRDLSIKPLFKRIEEVRARDASMRVYLQALEAMTGELFDPAVPFTADTSDPRQCDYCPFYYMCR